MLLLEKKIRTKLYQNILQNVSNGFQNFLIMHQLFLTFSVTFESS